MAPLLRTASISATYCWITMMKTAIRTSKTKTRRTEPHHPHSPPATLKPSNPNTPGIQLCRQRHNNRLASTALW